MDASERRTVQRINYRCTPGAKLTDEAFDIDNGNNNAPAVIFLHLHGPMNRERT